MAESSDALLAAVSQTCEKQGLDPALSPGETIRPPQLEAFYEATLAPQLGGESADGAQDAFDSDFVLGETLGRGGMGWVRGAEQRAIGRTVAVKTLRPERRGEHAAAALVREAQITGRLEHPNIVPVHALGESEREGPYLVMKRVEGASLRELLADPEHEAWGPSDGEGRFQRALEILMEVCYAVSFAHSRGVLHRDIKPENIMVGSYGEVYLLDWGIATLLEGGDEGERRVVGTPAYMSPELADPALPLDARSDVYLLGATLHELLTGRPRHAGQQLEAVLAAARRSAPAEYDAQLPAELCGLANQACAATPQERPPSAAAFREALAQFLRHRGSVAAAQRADQDRVQLEESLATSDDDAEADRDRQRAFASSRAGYAQALREWSENGAALRGLQRLLESMLDYELRSGNVRQAALLLAELPEPRPELAESVERARAAEEAQREAEAELQALRADQRIRGADWTRTLATLINGACVVPAMLIVGRLVRRGALVPTAIGDFWLSTLGMLIAVAVVWRFRKGVLDSARYRRLMMGLIVLNALLMVTALVAWRIDLPFIELMALQIYTCVAMAAALAVAGDRFMWLSAAFALGSWVGIVSAPQWAFEATAAGWAANTLWTAWVVRPGQGATGP